MILLLSTGHSFRLPCERPKLGPSTQPGMACCALLQITCCNRQVGMIWHNIRPFQSKSYRHEQHRIVEDAGMSSRVPLRSLKIAHLQPICMSTIQKWKVVVACSTL